MKLKEWLKGKRELTRLELLEFCFWSFIPILSPVALLFTILTRNHWKPSGKWKEVCS